MAIVGTVEIESSRPSSRSALNQPRRIFVSILETVIAPDSPGNFPQHLNKLPDHRAVPRAFLLHDPGASNMHFGSSRDCDDPALHRGVQ